jgi:alcohol oxidase
MSVSHGGFFSNVGREWLQIAPEYDQDRGSTEDPNDLSAQAINKWTVSSKFSFPKGLTHHISAGPSRLSLHNTSRYSFIFRWINQETGRRSTVTDHYIYSEQNTNLTVGAGCRVKRVIIE